MKCGKCSKLDAVIFCSKCNCNHCLSCLKTDLLENQHYNESYYFCQECQEQRAVKFCFSCDQHLCELCNSKIHNKGKRALHAVEQVHMSKFKVTYAVVILSDVKGLCEDSSELFLILCERFPSSNSETELTHQNIHLLIQGAIPLDLEVQGFSYSCMTSEQLNEEFLSEYCKYFPSLEKTVMIDSPEARKLKSKLATQVSLLMVGDTSNNSQNINIEPRVNLSTSTENESMTKTRKPPIAYFQFYKLAKEDKRAEAEIRMRKLAADGILILKRKEVDPIEGVVRSFVRTVGQVEVEYCSLEISYISVESLVWIIRSIKLDCMTPGQKLILSRIKESFDIKFHSKFWQSILNYIGSSRYQSEYDRGAFGYALPKILVNKSTDEIQLLLKGEEWVFDDQDKLDQSCQPWKDFTKFLLEYFEKSKTIPGGRYGCVQFVKTFGPESLRTTSLGKLSLFVQEAINKGIIRYHKTLLIRNVVEEQVSFTNQSSSFQEGEYSFSLNQKSLYIMQKDLKVRTIQIALINILVQNQHQCSLSLAQIPLFLKKSITFNFNLPELGFPKLKNLILTLSDKIDLQINKSTLNYTFSNSTEMLFNLEKDRLRRAAQDFLKIIVEIVSKIVRYLNIMMVDDLFTELNTKLGFEFEYRIFSAPDFCHFIYYYCNEVIHIEFMSGVFMAYSKQQPIQKQRSHHPQSRGSSFKENPETSTPVFCNSFTSKPPSYKLTDVNWYNHFEQEKKEEFVHPSNEQNDLIETVKFVDYLLNDDEDHGEDHRSATTYKTVIENENMVNDLDWSISNLISLPVSVNKTAHNKALSEDFEKKQMYYTHNRVMSTVQRKEHKD